MTRTPSTIDEHSHLHRSSHTHTRSQLFNAPSSSLRKDLKMTAPYGPYAGWDFYFPAAPPPHPGFSYPQQMLAMQPAVQWQQQPTPAQTLEDPLSERARKRGRFSDKRCFVCDGFDHLWRGCAMVEDHVNMKVESKVETQLADAADAVRQARLAVEEGGVGRKQDEAAMAKKDREIAGLKAKIALLEGEIKKESVSKPETDPAIKKESDGT
ncbi:uncharacterized protein MYCGRDRAFT_106929 [Zymoseptoria tritici IPO323]|uniref:Uncharacterized protein n=1 Tax=Zymoseptoria tritici (strain CBS 115943 / IPO323) TaxID=336722 RepID=F9WYW7_ZYMTI|nr:uncharacterized protein MYCGRDRAFT_106929 [Zymoseptoria tritici IPO323]EGP92600.1 hypothetical protein MYCGRDRAFT_106929 [Zymoseptoria tritici IPO323]